MTLSSYLHDSAAQEADDSRPVNALGKIVREEGHGEQDKGLHHPHVLWNCMQYRVTEQLVQNLPLTSEQKFRFGLACPG